MCSDRRIWLCDFLLFRHVIHHSYFWVVKLYKCFLTVPDKNCSDVICPDEVEKCPEDSYRLPAYKSPEDCCLTPQNCKCLPRECKQRVCPPGQHPKIVRPGNGRPGTCCPLYDCISDKSKQLKKLSGISLALNDCLDHPQCVVYFYLKS